MGKVAIRRKSAHLGYLIQKRQSGFFWILLVVLIVVGVWLWHSRVFSPMVFDLCKAKANRIGQETIHRSVAELLEKEIYCGNSFLKVQTSEEGEPSLVLPDTAMMNRFRSELVLLINERLEEIKTAQISIPLGNLSGMEFFSNRGPSFAMEAYPSGEVWVELFSRFSDAGVNQTRHAMSVQVTLDVSLMLPGHNSYGTRVVAIVPMSETVVVGSVPNSYTNLETEKENIKDDLLNLVDN